MVTILNNKISNKKVEVPKGIEINNQDELTILITFLKGLEKNMTVALTESSHEELYNRFKKMFDNIALMQRKIYELMFKYGWYSLEGATKTKIDTLLKELNTQMDNLN